MANETKNSRTSQNTQGTSAKSTQKTSGRSADTDISQSTPGVERDQRSSTSSTTSSRTNGSSLQQDGQQSEHKSFSQLVGQSFAEESQEGVERVLNEVKRYFDASRTYVQENPREAAGLAVAAGVVAWALLGTKPGRLAFESGVAVGVPFVTKWFSRNLTSLNH